MIYLFDIDGTICSDVKPNSDCRSARPLWNRIKTVNALYQQGHTINLYTARGTVTGIDWREITEQQLKRWGLKYHSLSFGKPHYDIWVDDKCINAIDFFT